ncbi:OmpP1/FadL family transporter [Planctomycetota bacterium]
MTRRFARFYAFALLASLGALLPGMQRAAMGAAFGIEEISAKAVGMARAFTATADEPTAVYYNPAAIARLRGWQGYASTHLIDAHTTHNTYERWYGMSNQKLKEGFQVVPGLFDSLGFDISDRMRLGVGGGIFVPFGLAVDWSKSPQWGGRFLATSASIHSVEYNLLTSAVEFDITDNLTVGVGQGNSLVTTDVKVQRHLFLNLPSEPIAKFDLSTGTSHVDYRWSLGGIVRLLRNRVRAGVAYRSDLSNVHLKGTGNVFGDPTGKFAMASTSRLVLSLPGEFRAGLAFDLLADRLTIEFDYKWTNWSVMKTFALQSTDRQLNGNPFEFEWRDSNYFALGLEYDVATVADEGLGFSLRCGAYLDESPVPTKQVTPLLPDSDRLGFSAGFGFSPNEHITLDMGYLAVAFGRLRKHNHTGQSLAPTTGEGSYYSWANVLSFGLTVKF